MKKITDKQKNLAKQMLVGMTTVTLLSGCAAAQSGAPSSPAEATTAAAYITQEAVSETAAQDVANYKYAQNYREAYEAKDGQTEEYRKIEENGFLKVKDHPLSTFSADVDTAAYSNIRRMIEQGQPIPPDAVRIEEMINYFRYDYKQPEGEEPLALTAEFSDCPWNPESRLMLLGLKAKDIDFSHRPMSNLVFLLDVSGSMYEEDKLPLVQKSFALLTEELTENDRVSVVTYAGYESVILDGVSGQEKGRIKDAIMSLTAGGSTAGSAGIQKSYELARKHYIAGGNNRVILATDGDLNVGITSENDLIQLISRERQAGVHLSVLGFGQGNIKDNKMMALADNGDGNYRYIDSMMEAKKVLVEEMGGTLITVAKDVKLQVEFNPVMVESYRLVGYEKRKLNDEDFANDKVDAGETGAGHNVTALYEIVPASTAQADGELLNINIRYKAPNGQESKLTRYPVLTDVYSKELPDNLRFAAAVAEFGMILRNSPWQGNASYDSVLELAQPSAGKDDYRSEFVALVKKAADEYRLE